MNRNKIFHIVIILAAFALLVAACQPDEMVETPVVTEDVAETEAPTEAPVETEPVEETEPPESVEGQSVSGPIILDPAITQNEDALMISSYLYDGLFTINDAGEIAGALASDWTLSDDQLDIIIELRPNAQFHDGSLLTADTVVENFDRWFIPDHPLHGDSEQYQAWLSYFGGFLGDLDDEDKPISPYDGIEKVDDFTVLIHLNRPLPEFLEYMTDPAFQIISTAVYADDMDTYGTSEGTAVGSGPYMLESWADGVITLVPNESYWGDVPGEPLVFIVE